MKNTKIIFPAVLFALFATAGCTDKIELDLPEGEKFLVVEGWISNEDGPQDIQLTFTAPYFDSQAVPRATGATVSISDDLGLETVLEEVAPGTYRYPTAGEIGRSYTLRIGLPDGEQYQSRAELLQEPVAIDTIYWQLSEDEPNEDNDEEPDDIYDVLIDTREPAGAGDHYRWRSILNGEEQREPFDIFVVTDEFVDGNAIPGFNITEDLYSQPDTVVIIQERISKRAYDFFTLVQLQTAFVGGHFDTPPAPIEGNVLNLNDRTKDALGFFGAAGRDRAMVVVGE